MEGKVNYLFYLIAYNLLERGIGLHVEQVYCLIFERLVWVGDWCVSRLERLICCQIILTASSPGSLLICWSLAIRLLV